MSWKISGTVYNHQPPDSGGKTAYTGVKKRYDVTGSVTGEKLYSAKDRWVFPGSPPL